MISRAGLTRLVYLFSIFIRQVPVTRQPFCFICTIILELGLIGTIYLRMLYLNLKQVRFKTFFKYNIGVKILSCLPDIQGSKIL